MATALVDAQVPQKAIGFPCKGALNSFENFLHSPFLSKSCNSITWKFPTSCSRAKYSLMPELGVSERFGRWSDFRARYVQRIFWPLQRELGANMHHASIKLYVCAQAGVLTGGPLWNLFKKLRSRKMAQWCQVLVSVSVSDPPGCLQWATLPHCAECGHAKTKRCTSHIIVCRVISFHYTMSCRSKLISWLHTCANMMYRYNK